MMSATVQFELRRFPSSLRFLNYIHTHVNTIGRHWKEMRTGINAPSRIRIHNSSVRESVCEAHTTGQPVSALLVRLLVFN
jgi:sRNA-binding carbon storage regulator CsrA